MGGSWEMVQSGGARLPTSRLARTLARPKSSNDITIGPYLTLTRRPLLTPVT
jgi:hypothetical protein